MTLPPQTCLCGRSLLSSFFGFIVGYIFLLLFSGFPPWIVLLISFFTTFGYLGSYLENPLDINLQSLAIFWTITSCLYGLLFLFLEDFLGLIFATFVVGTALPYLEIILRMNNILTSNNYRNEQDDEITGCQCDDEKDVMI